MKKLWSAMNYPAWTPLQLIALGIGTGIMFGLAPAGCSMTEHLVAGAWCTAAMLPFLSLGIFFGPRFYPKTKEEIAEDYAAAFRAGREVERLAKMNRLGEV